MLAEETIQLFAPTLCLGAVLALVQPWSELDQVFSPPESKLLGVEFPTRMRSCVPSGVDNTKEGERMSSLAGGGRLG